MSEITLLHGDNRKVLKTLADKSVNTCVTSPPYFGLRDYGSAQWIDGVIPDCPHLNAGPSPLNPKVTVCWDCSAVKEDKQIGLEETPEEYVAALVEVFREVKRVLRDDGTLWLNLGDSYSGGGGFFPDAPSNKNGNSISSRQNDNSGAKPKGIKAVKINLPPKNLIGIPWRVAFALQADGYILRSDIIWSKPNAMPESVTDRPAKSHEYIFLFSKQQKYYYDNEAIAEPLLKGAAGSKFNVGKTAIHQLERSQNGDRLESEYRNKRSVWTVSSQPYSGAHYAVFPEKLIEPCILAGCPEDGTVLDPFGGSGTTGRVAVKNRRNAVLIELNPEYHKQIEKRTDGVQVKLF